MNTEVINFHYKNGHKIANTFLSFNLNICFKWMLNDKILLSTHRARLAKFLAQNCDYFLTHKFKHVFWVLKRTVSLRRFF